MTPEERLERIAAWGASERGVDALILLGSRPRTQTPADAFSDIDLLLVADDPDRWITDASWVEAFGTPLITFVEETPLRGRFERRVLYDDGGDADFVPLGHDDMEALIGTSFAAAVLGRGHRVLHDRSGRLAAMLAAAPIGDPVASLPDAAAFVNAVGNFWYHLVWTARKLRRGEVFVAMECLNGHMGGLLVELARWETLAAGRADVWFGARYLERWALPVTVERLRACFPRYDPADVERALWAAADVFADVAPPVAQRVGVTYPIASERAARQLATEVLS